MLGVGDVFFAKPFAPPHPLNAHTHTHYTNRTNPVCLCPSLPCIQGPYGVYMVKDAFNSYPKGCNEGQRYD